MLQLLYYPCSIPYSEKINMGLKLLIGGTSMGLFNDFYDKADEIVTKHEIEKQAKSDKEAKAKKAAEELKKKENSSSLL
jgi:hypothetical protein